MELKFVLPDHGSEIVELWLFARLMGYIFCDVMVWEVSLRLIFTSQSISPLLDSAITEQKRTRDQKIHSNHINSPTHFSRS
jgi:hypothetical protein